jgi:protein-L-isoaspartate(D-aspartate) O-methyltransferase
MLAIAGVADNPKLEDAFASVPRERFVGPPPWAMSRGGIYAGLTSDDPVVLYQDVLVALAPERGINNGSPSLHAFWLNALGPREGGRIVHIGAGTGYYSAILGRLVGPEGHVVAVEFDPALDELAAANLAGCGNISVVHGDGAEWPREPADGIYVNFAAVRPAKAWLDQLAPGGRLIFPLGLPGGREQRRRRRALLGASFLIERRAGGLSASWMGETSFVGAEGALSGSEEERAALAAAFEKDGARDSARLVRSLSLSGSTPPERCWLRGEGWCLSYDEVPPAEQS